MNKKKEPTMTELKRQIFIAYAIWFIIGMLAFIIGVFSNNSGFLTFSLVTVVPCILSFICTAMEGYFS